MLGDAISSLPLRLSDTAPTIGCGHGDQAVWDAAVAPLEQRPLDARAERARPQADLAATRALARPAAHPWLPRRDGSGDEDRRAANSGVAADLPGAGAAQAGACPLFLRP